MSTQPTVATATARPKRQWQRPVATEYDTRAEITAYSGDRDIPWISR